MPSKLSQDISPFYVMDVLERAKELERQGDRIIHFEVGEPDFPTPAPICREAESAINEGDTKYTHSMGMPELREAISEDYRRAYGINLSPSRVAITMGSSPALFLSMISHIEPGDEVVITDPYYACYPQIIKIAGGVPKTVRIYEEEGFQINISRLKKAITSRTRAILINSPANPTGMVLRGEVIKKIAGLGIYVISDEIYHGLTYGEEANTILRYTDNACVVNGFSKFYSMTGWRLGYLIVPEACVRPLQKLQQNLFISVSPFVQRAGIKALRDAKNQAARRVLYFDERRKTILKGLRRLGFTIKAEPKGAFYVFVDVSALGKDSHALSFDILESAKVAITPGIDFGHGGQGYLRFSYATSISDIKEGIQRLGRYIEDKRGTVY